jgi:uncharacterized protein YktA (UPF0223 family)
MTTEMKIAVPVDLEDSSSLTEEEMNVVSQFLRQIEEAQRRLGIARTDFICAKTAYQETEKKLVREINLTGAAYTAFVDVLAKKHVQRPGRFEFRPERAAFVEVKE